MPESVDGSTTAEAPGARPTLFQSLQWRIFLLLAGSLTVVLTLFSVTYHHYMSRQIEREAANQAGLVAETIRLGLTQAMQNNNRDAIIATLNNIVRNSDLVEVLIADSEGTIRYSSRPNLLGQDLRQMIYGRLGGERPWKVMPESEGAPPALYRAVTIMNRGECITCHGERARVLGTLGIAISTAPAQHLLRLSRNFLFAIVFLVLGLLFVLNYFFLSRRVTGPLLDLIGRFSDAGRGNFRVEDARRRLVHDEIGLLHRKFEEMIGELEKQHEIHLSREREIVALQRDHRYQAELEEVNIQLSNRIAELDRANTQINKLALQLEERNRSLEKAFKNISALNRVGVALSSELDLDRLVNLLINISVKGLRVEIGFIMLLDEPRGRLQLRAWTGIQGEFDAALPVDLGESVSGRVALTGRPILIRRLDGTQGINKRSRYGFTRHSVLAVPIRIKDRLLGTIELTNKKGEESFSDEDQEMLQSISNQAAVAIENANLYREVQKSYFDTIRALVQAVEEKDEYTRGHSERVTIFSVKIAMKMGVDARKVQAIRYAGVLHDIGKIGIDLDILQKKGRLTTEEYSVIKNHPMIGERIIRPISFLAEVLPGVMQHHERYDGFGYPLGIRGEQMTIEARILGVADAYDAMITERPYRKPLPRRDAIAELRRCSGTQFDPIVVEHFIEILDNDPEIQELERMIPSVGA